MTKSVAIPFVELPPGYRAEARPGAWFAVREDFAERFAAWGVEPATGEPFEDSGLVGRQALATVRGSEGRVLVRQFRHGGLFAPVTGDRFASPARPFRELALAARLGELGLPTPAVLAARARAARPFGWRLELFTERLSGAGDLGRRMEERRSGALDSAHWRRLVWRLGELVGRGHAAGFQHGDLHPKNVLEDTEGRLVFVDLDGSVVVEPPDEAACVVNLERLWRWIAREDRRAPLLVARDPLRFLAAYRRARPEVDVRALAHAVSERHRRHAPLHTIGRRVQRR